MSLIMERVRVKILFLFKALTSAVCDFEVLPTTFWQIFPVWNPTATAGKGNGVSMEMGGLLQDQ